MATAKATAAGLERLQHLEVVRIHQKFKWGGNNYMVNTVYGVALFIMKENNGAIAFLSHASFRGFHMEAVDSKGSRNPHGYQWLLRTKSTRWPILAHYGGLRDLQGPTMSFPETSMNFLRVVVERHYISTPVLWWGYIDCPIWAGRPDHDDLFGAFETYLYLPMK